MENPTLMASLDTLGFLTLPIDDDLSEFLGDVDAGTARWWYGKLDEELAAKGGYSEEDIQHIKAYFDPTTNEGRDHIFRTPKGFGDEWLAGRIRYILQGDSKMGLAKMHKSWSRAGMGFWAHLVPGRALDLVRTVKDALGAMGISSHITGLPHLIHKPPGGAELKAHHDQFNPLDLIAALEEHVQSEDPSNTAWANKHGVQCLAHLDGGIEDGYTFSIGPMTREVLLICMKAIRDGKVDGILPKGTSLHQWLHSSEGPYFLNWKACLPQLNAILAADGHPPLSVLPMRPASGTGPAAVVWLRGDPHGSAKNTERRMTFTVPLGTKRPREDATVTRFLDRAEHLARIAETGDAASEAYIRADTRPYNDGKTHKKPHLAADWIRPGAPFHALAPTRAQVAAYREAVGEEEGIVHR